MTKSHKSYLPVNYRIRLKGYLDNKWSDWFEQMTISFEDEETILTGQLADSAISRAHGT